MRFACEHRIQKKLIALYAFLMLLVPVFLASHASADFNACATDWNNFQNNPGFIADYTFQGQIIKDHESSGSGDPSRGPANVPPAATDLASGADAITNPGSSTTPFFGYYNGGTTYDPNNPITMEDDYIFFRMRLSGDPSDNKNAFSSYHWNVLLDVDADGYKEYWIDLEGSCTQQVCGGVHDRLNLLYDNSNQQDIPDPDASGVRVEYFQARNGPDGNPSCTGTSPGLSHSQVLSVGDGSGDYWLDIQVPMTAFNDSNGNQVLFPDSPVAFVFSTGASNQDPLQKDHMMDLGFMTSADPINFGDIVYPNGKPIIEFSDSSLNFVSFYTIGDSVYLWVTDRLANNDANAVETIPVTITNTTTGDDEIVMLEETGPATGIFTNPSGCSLCSSLTSSNSDGIPNNSDNSGDIELISGDTIYVSYTNPNYYTVTDKADIVDQCEAYIQFTRANGLPSEQFQLTEDRTTSDKLYITISHSEANTDPLAQQTISAVVVTGTSTDQKTMNGPYVLTETGNDTGVFRNVTGLDTEIATSPVTQEDDLWEDSDGGTVTASYSYACLGTLYTQTATANLFFTDDAGRVFFTTAFGTQDVELYAPNQEVYIKVEDESYTCMGPVTVTMTGPASGDSEDLVLSETSPGSGTYLNSSPSAVITSVWDGVSVPNANDGTLELSDSDTLTVTYYDCFDGDSDTTNNNKIDTASYNAPALIINKILFYPDSMTCQTEFIEIYNPSSQPVNATGFRITDEDSFSYTVPQFQGVDLTLQSGESIILSLYSSDTAPFPTDVYLNGAYYLFDPSYPTYPSNELGAPGDADPADQIALYNTSNVIIDYIGWSNTVTPSVDFLGDDSNAVSRGIWQDDSFKNISGMSIGYALERSPRGHDTNDPSDWTLASSSSTVCETVITHAVVSSFNARTEKGHVIIEWETSSEAGTIGFHLYRFDYSSGRYKRINRRLLPGLIISPQGGTYRYIDAGSLLNQGNTYLLVEVQADGKEKTYGPYSIEREGDVVIAGLSRQSLDMSKGSDPLDETVVYQYVNSEGTIIITDERSTIKRLKIKRQVQVFYENAYGGSTQTVLATDKPYSSSRSGDASLSTGSNRPEFIASDASQNAEQERAGTGPQEATYPLNDDFFIMKPHAVSEEAEAILEERISSLQEKRLSRKMRKGDTAKIAITKDGLYYLDATEIASLLNLPLTKTRLLIESNRLSLRSKDIDIAFLSADDGAGIYFYGTGIESIYTDKNIYWLTQGKGKHVDVIETAGTSTAPCVETFAETIHFEEDRFPVTSFDIPETDYWFWDYISSGLSGGDSKVFLLSLPGVRQTSDTAILKVHLQGLTDSSAGLDHHAIVVLNGSTIAESRWDGKEPHTITIAFSQNLLKEGDNHIEIKGILDPDIPYGIFFIDSFDLNYQRLLNAVNDTLMFRADGTAGVVISGFSNPGIYLFDVSVPWNPKLIEGTTIQKIDGEYTISFIPVPDNVYVAVSSGGISSDIDTWVDKPSRLHEENNKADHLIITAAELSDAAHALADYREAQGLISKVVDLEDIMDEFNDGIDSPQAIQDFLKYAYLNWQKPPLYIVLAGNGSFDYKNVLKKNDNVIPAIMKATPYGLFPSDSHFADVNGDTVPEIAIGRIPVLTENQLSDVIGKIITYETSGAPDESKVLLLADDPVDGADFTSDSDHLASHVPEDYSIRKIYLAEHPADTARQLLSQEMNNGTDFINYLGHGGFDRFADEGLLKSDDIASLTNAGRLPVVTAMTCMVGHFAFPGLDSLGEELITNGSGGAVAVWSPSGLSVHSKAIILNTLFYTAALSNSSSRGVLGDVLLKVSTEYSYRETDPFMIALYNLLGDPALVLH